MIAGLYPQQYVAGIQLNTWVKRDNVEQSFLFKETVLGNLSNNDSNANKNVTWKYNFISSVLFQLIQLLQRWWTTQEPNW